MWYAQARYGNVSLYTQDDCVDCLLTRKEALDLIVKLSTAYQMSGDMSEPGAVFLREEAERQMRDFLEREKEHS